MRTINCIEPGNAKHLEVLVTDLTAGDAVTLFLGRSPSKMYEFPLVSRGEQQPTVILAKEHLPDFQREGVPMGKVNALNEEVERWALQTHYPAPMGTYKGPDFKAIQFYHEIAIAKMRKLLLQGGSNRYGMEVETRETLFLKLAPFGAISQACLHGQYGKSELLVDAHCITAYERIAEGAGFLADGKEGDSIFPCKCQDLKPMGHYLESSEGRRLKEVVWDRITSEVSLQAEDRDTYQVLHL